LDIRRFEQDCLEAGKTRKMIYNPKYRVEIQVAVRIRPLRMNKGETHDGAKVPMRDMHTDLETQGWLLGFHSTEHSYQSSDWR
jgi:hypothetical protein